MTITECARMLSNGSTTAVALVEGALEKAKESKSYNATLSLIESRALERAARSDQLRAAGHDIGALEGIPFIAKDNMLAFGAPTTAAAKLLEGYQAPYQSEAISRLEAAGAILIGKANLDAFAHGGSTENSAYGPTLNPHDPERIPGGSSGGSAASVALDIVPFALGTDTGGSIRLPASFCGVFGLKPTYGRVSRYGVIAMASSTDTVGVMAHNANDIDLVMQTMSGLDVNDMTTIGGSYDTPAVSSKKRIAVVEEWMGDGVREEVAQVVHDAVSKYESLGYQVDTISLPTLQYSLAVYYVVVPAEIASNLARFDGVRYGQRKPAADLTDMYTETRDAGFMPENERRIMIGNYVLSSGYYDAYYRKAQLVRTKIINEMNAAFAQYDALIGPVAPTIAPKIGEKSDPIEMYKMDLMTVAASLAGLPAISVPYGAVDGMPVGLQIVGPAHEDKAIVNLSRIAMEARG